MNNRYFIIANDDKINIILSVAVGKPENQRFSLNGQQIVIKLHQNDNNNYNFLSAYEEQNHDQILNILSGPEWTNPEILE